MSAHDARPNTLPGVLRRLEPEAQALPVVFDSPHSGNQYPGDFGFAAPFRALRAAEDMYVDELFAAAPAHGAALLCALFPRSYVDPNRHPLDLDAALLASPWPGALRPGEKCRHGKGLIRARAGGRPVYDRRLSVAEVQRRLERCYRPYHDALAGLVAARKARFGRVWHVNCHSWTPPLVNGAGEPVNHIDVCLGDRRGTTAGAAFTAFVADTLRAMGYVVRVNRPFRGMELIRRHGRPAAGQHALQIEINRRLYMDPHGYARTEGFARLRDDLTTLVARIAEYARARIAPATLAARADAAD